MADLAVAFTALFVSLCSLGIALHHGRTMQRLVEANSRPFIQFTFSNAEHAAGGAVTQAMTVSISNPGAGAARVEKFSILVDGQSVDNMSDALQRLAGLPNSAALGPITYQDVAPSYIKAGSDQLVLRWPRTEGNNVIWDRVLSLGYSHVKLEACYCSIFDECWVENSSAFKPTPVKSCS